jgi:DNA-binding transcriptional regulator YhcF (GntR family)
VTPLTCSTTLKTLNNQGIITMKPLKRKFVNKKSSAKRFKGHVRKTKSANISSPMRGGWRM